MLVDNGSTDGTPEVARRVAEECGAADRLEVHSYPFSVARCGEEHLGTRAESVHSLVYFYNWSFSHVRTGYVLKWDADMVLTDAAAGVLRDLAWQLEADEVVVKIPRYPLYVVDDRRAFLDVGMSNTEPWAWPNRPGYSFVKAMEWEQPLWPATLPTLVLPDWSCLELKRLDADEFSHWIHTDFGQSGARAGSGASGRSSTPSPTARRHPRTSSPSRRRTACMSSSTFARPSYRRWPPSGATSARGSSAS